MVERSYLKKKKIGKKKPKSRGRENGTLGILEVNSGFTNAQTRVASERWIWY